MAEAVDNANGYESDKDSMKDIYDTPDDPIHGIIEYIVKDKSIYFKHRRIGAPDISIDEKRAIAMRTFKYSHRVFLQTYGRHLKRKHLDYFQRRFDFMYINDELEGDLEILGNILLVENRNRTVRRRRFEAMTRMVEEGTYFSELEMMNRDPWSYEMNVGRYMTEEEKEARDRAADPSDLRLSSILLKNIDRMHLMNRLKLGKAEATEEQMSDLYPNFYGTDDDDDDVEDKDEESVAENRVQWGEFDESNEKKTKGKKMKTIPKISAEKKERFRQEFVMSMQERFLNGLDKDFIDYDSIDKNEDYDNSKIAERDAEDDYFNSSSPEEARVLLEDDIGYEDFMARLAEISD